MAHARGLGMIKAEPYRILFSLGLLAALVGIAFWPLFQAGQLAYYPREAHAQLMIFGFLLAFASGFLMTAAPRMSGALPSQPWETALASALVLAQIFAQINFTGEKVAYGLALLQFAFLFRFLLSRRPRSSGGRTPPPYFLFLPLGLLLGSAGCALRLIGVPLEELSRILLFKGFLMCLVLGVGIRLLPVFLSGAATPMEASPPEHDAGYKEAGLVALFYILALFTEVSLPWLGNLMQLCLLAGLLQFRLKISHPPLGRGVQPWGVWISLLCKSL